MILTIVQKILLIIALAMTFISVVSARELYYNSVGNDRTTSIGIVTCTIVVILVIIVLEMGG